LSGHALLFAILTKVNIGFDRHVLCFWVL